MGRCWRGSSCSLSVSHRSSSRRRESRDGIPDAPEDHLSLGDKPAPEHPHHTPNGHCTGTTQEGDSTRNPVVVPVGGRRYVRDVLVDQAYPLHGLHADPSPVSSLAPPCRTTTGSSTTVSRDGRGGPLRGSLTMRWRTSDTNPPRTRKRWRNSVSPTVRCTRHTPRPARRCFSHRRWREAPVDTLRLRLWQRLVLYIYFRYTVVN